MSLCPRARIWNKYVKQQEWNTSVTHRKGENYSIDDCKFLNDTELLNKYSVPQSA